MRTIAILLRLIAAILAASEAQSRNTRGASDSKPVCPSELKPSSQHSTALQLEGIRCRRGGLK